MSVRKILIALILLLEFLVACSSPSPTATLAPTATPRPTNTPFPTATLTPTATARPTNTPFLTATPTPTATSRPTSTPLPTATSEPSATPPSTNTAEPPTPALLALGDVRTRSADGMVMVYVPGGDFLMGSTEAEIEAALALCEQQSWTADCQRSRFEDETPQHVVTLDGFWMDRTEVTCAQYELCVADGGCTKEPGFKYDCAGDGYAMGSVTWQKAADYCAWAGGRLPTEAQWEYAARGAQGATYPWGDRFDGARLNYKDEGLYEEGAPVGSFPSGASWCGVLDMAGNVWEWVSDWYAGDYYGRSSAHDPGGPSSGNNRVLRGGSWDNEFTHLRSAGRFDLGPGSRTPNIGFRCVVD